MWLHWIPVPFVSYIFQYTRVLIFLLMRFLLIFYRIELCANVCVSVNWSSAFFHFIRMFGSVFCVVFFHSSLLLLLLFFIIQFIFLHIRLSFYPTLYCPTNAHIQIPYIYIARMKWLSLLLPAILLFFIACLPLFLFPS